MPFTEEEAERALTRLPALEQFLEDEMACPPHDPFQHRIDAIVERWGATGDAAVLSDLLGLGIGSTFSGDDILVGILGGLEAF